MLHPIEPVLENELRAVLAFQRDVLAFACRSDLDCATQNTPKNTDRILFDEQQLSAAFGTRAAWIKRHTSLHARIKAVNTAVRSDGSLGVRVLEVFDHDTGFDDHCDELGFALEVGQLPPELLPPLRDLLEAFYKLLSKKGFESAVTGCGSVSRLSFVRAFWEQHSVCPACDAARPDMLPAAGGAAGGQCDHHLPKSVYPTLSVHPLNLVPICSDCNASFKGARDPLDKASLAELFLPYRRPMFGPAAIVVSRRGTGRLAVEIHDASEARSDRVAAFDHAYQLIERWADRLNHRVKDNIETYLRNQMRNWSVGRWAVVAADPADAAETLWAQSGFYREDRGRKPDALLSEAYCAFAATDTDELAVLSGCAGAA